MATFIFSLIIFISIIFQILFIVFLIWWLFFLFFRKLQTNKKIIHSTTLKIEKILLKADKMFFSLKTWQHTLLFVFTGSAWIISYIYCFILKKHHHKKLYKKLMITDYLKKHDHIKLQFGGLKNNLYRKLKKHKNVKKIKVYKDRSNFNNHYNTINKPHKNKKEIDYNSLDYIDILNGIEFEKYMAKLLPKLGYVNVKLTPASNDYGVDLTAEKDDIKFAIQCKHYKGKVNNSSIQETNSGKSYYKCHIGVVVTNSYFTANAMSLAKNNGIILWDREKLKEILKIANNEV